MLSENYVVLKKVYNFSKSQEDGFVRKNDLIQSGCSKNTITCLEFQNLLTYMRRDKEDFYRITHSRVDYLYTHKRENVNMILSFIAAVASIISVVISLK